MTGSDRSPVVVVVVIKTNQILTSYLAHKVVIFMALRRSDDMDAVAALLLLLDGLHDITRAMN